MRIYYKSTTNFLTTNSPSLSSWFHNAFKSHKNVENQHRYSLWVQSIQYIDLPWTFECESVRLFLDNMFNSPLGQICTLHPVILCFHITIFASSSHISMSYLYKLQIYVLISCSTYLQQPSLPLFCFSSYHTMFYLGCLQTHSWEFSHIRKQTSSSICLYIYNHMLVYSLPPWTKNHSLMMEDWFDFISHNITNNVLRCTYIHRLWLMISPPILSLHKPNYLNHALFVIKHIV